MPIELDGPEVPIMDGSSRPFVFLYNQQASKNKTIPRNLLKLRKTSKLSRMINGQKLSHLMDLRLILQLTLIILLFQRKPKPQL